VHQLWPPPEGKHRTELDVLLFHGLQFTDNGSSDAWKNTWTQRGHDDVCWPQEWLPFDLGEAVRIFSISYNAHVVTSPHDHVSEIAHNLVQNLMNRRYEFLSLVIKTPCLGQGECARIFSYVRLPCPEVRFWSICEVCRLTSDCISANFRYYYDMAQQRIVQGKWNRACANLCCAFKC
jgi:hypothetical protein